MTEKKKKHTHVIFNLDGAAQTAKASWGTFKNILDLIKKIFRKNKSVEEKRVLKAFRKKYLILVIFLILFSIFLWFVSTLII